MCGSRPSGTPGLMVLSVVVDLADRAVVVDVVDTEDRRTAGRCRDTSRTQSPSASTPSSVRIPDSSRSVMKATAPAQNTFPMTEASWVRAFRSGGSVSSRAAMSACKVEGNSRGDTSVETPRCASSRSRSRRARTSSSAYRGLPPARSSSAACAWGETSADGSRLSRRASASSPVSGDSDTVVARSRSAAHVGARSVSSGRAVATTSNGTRSAASTRCSRKASRAGSAQWMSSTTATSGAVRATASRNRRHAVKASSRSTGDPASSPTRGARRVRSQASSGVSNPTLSRRQTISRGSTSATACRCSHLVQPACSRQGAPGPNANSTSR